MNTGPLSDSIDPRWRGWLTHTVPEVNPKMPEAAIGPLFTCPRCGPTKLSVAHAAGIVLAIICTGCHRLIYPPENTADE